MGKINSTTIKFLRNEIIDNGLGAEDNVGDKNIEMLKPLATKLAMVDPRMQGKVTYKASTIMLAALAGIIAGGQTWNEVADYGAAKVDVLRLFDPTIEQAPSHDTLRRFFMIISPDKLEQLYRPWASDWRDKAATCQPVPDDVDERNGIRRHVAIDGKTIRNAIDAKRLVRESGGAIDAECASTAKLHMVSAYDTAGGISLAQERVEVKENELVAIPKLLNTIAPGKGDVVAIDAMGTHKNLAQAIIDKDADYLFEVKDNQRKLKARIRKALDRAKSGTGAILPLMKYEEYSHDHSTETIRTCILCNDNIPMAEEPNAWPKFSTYGAVKARKAPRNGIAKEEEHFFITSLPRDPALIMKHKREHWQIENGLHWQLDVTFNEDGGRKMMNSAQNYSTLTKMVLALLKRNGRKLPIGRKRKTAGWNDEYMAELIAQFLLSF